MIIDHIRYAFIYRSLGPLFGQAFDYFEHFDSATMDGRIDLVGDELFMLVQTFKSAPPAEKNFETHRHYVDIQYIFSGEETIWYQPASLLRPKAEYDAEKDVQFLHGIDNRPLLLGAGDFTIFWPQDGHKPACWRDGPSQVRKIVAKVRIS
jgi:biofilm protein TabA